MQCPKCQDNDLVEQYDSALNERRMECDNCGFSCEVPAKPYGKFDDARMPKLEKVGVYFHKGTGETGFHSSDNMEVKNGDVFVYNQGILFRVLGWSESMIKN